MGPKYKLNLAQDRAEFTTDEGSLSSLSPKLDVAIMRVLVTKPAITHQVDNCFWRLLGFKVYHCPLEDVQVLCFLLLLFLPSTRTNLLLVIVLLDNKHID